MKLYPQANPVLAQALSESIIKRGPATFKWFMEQCLYHPELGYYGSGRAQIGGRGDFFTSVSVGRCFGQLMARQFDEMWKVLGSPPGFVLLEQGAHDGQFADDVLSWLERFSPDLLGILTYWIIEPSDALAARQQKKLARWPRSLVRWSKSLSDLDDGSVLGVHFSNELLDAFAIHLVTCRDNQWRENYIDWSRNGFILSEGEPSTQELRNYLQRLPAMPSQPYRTEINLRSLRWIEEISRVMRRGYVLICDYGYSRDQFLAPERREGTLSFYREHKRVTDLFQHIGNCDITAHVEFTSLVEHALTRSFKLNGFTDQHHFMIGLGEDLLRLIEHQSGQNLPLEARDLLNGFRTLMHPQFMGMSHKFLCLEKEMDNRLPLTGFRYGGDPTAGL